MITELQASRIAQQRSDSTKHERRGAMGAALEQLRVQLRAADERLIIASAELAQLRKENAELWRINTARAERIVALEQGR